MTGTPEWDYPETLYCLPVNAKPFAERITAPRVAYHRALPLPLEPPNAEIEAALRDTGLPNAALDAWRAGR